MIKVNIVVFFAVLLLIYLEENNNKEMRKWKILDWNISTYHQNSWVVLGQWKSPLRKAL